MLVREPPGGGPDIDPYRPPAVIDSAVGPGIVATAESEGYHPLRGRARLAIGTLGLWMAANSIAFWAALRQSELLARLSNDAYREAEVWANERRMQLAAAGRFLALVAAGVAFLALLVRANRNARALGATELAHGPAAAVLWFFVPVLNLWQPYRITREVWLASEPRPRGPWFLARPSRIVPAWWAASLAYVAIEWIARRIAGRAPDVGDLVVATRIELVACTVGFLAAALAIRLVRELTWRQEERRRLRPG
jgi:hypothetical protein